MNIEILEAVSEKLEVRFGCNKNFIFIDFEELWKFLIQFEQFEGGSKVIFRTVWSHVIIISKRHSVGSKVKRHAYASSD